MKTISINLYSFNELSDKAKQRAMDDHTSTSDFFWGDPYISSIKKGLDAFNCSLVNYSIDWGCSSHSNFKIRYGLVPSEITGLRLRTYILNNFYAALYCRRKYGKRKSKIAYKKTCCPFTGYIGDDDFLQPIRDFISRPCEHTNFDNLMDECVEAVIASGCKDYDYCCTEEYLSEHFEANDYQFTENGKRY